MRGQLGTWCCCVALSVGWATVGRGDLFVAPNETLRSNVDTGQVINQGLAVGSAGKPLVFGSGTRVRGGGEFVSTLPLGVFAPGNSPGVTTGTNQAFGATSILEIELGGTVPGFGAGHHDQINDSGTVTLIEGPTLTILPYGGFTPTAGDEFVLITWKQGLVGSFGSLNIAQEFLSHGITFTSVITNPTGAGNLTLRATAVPEVGAFVGLLVSGVLALGAVKLRVYARIWLS